MLLARTVSVAGEGEWIYLRAAQFTDSASPRTRLGNRHG